jgi:hypothetical protein
MKRIVLALLFATGVARAADLERAFTSPPESARPWVYWFPLSGNLTREGITADFEAMARVGIGGALYMEVDQGAPKGPADYAGPLWRELFQHACKEAHRLGLEINMNNDAGWCGSGGPWITPELSMQKVVWSEMVIEGGTNWAVAVPEPKSVQSFYRDIAVLAMPAPADDYRIKDLELKLAAKPRNFLPPQTARLDEAPAGAVIPRDRIVDLTGKKTWDVPPGRWLVMRFGHTTTGVNNLPAPESGRGLECDKFNKEAVAVHYRNLMGTLVAENKALSGRGRTLVSTHIDSWEVGSQNWTPRMREEFKALRGYDLIPYLPAYAGRVVDSVEVTERFLWDLRQTISDLIVENYAGEFRRLANRDGLRLSIEAYDGAPVDEMTYGGQADEPMAEFWSWFKWGKGIGAAYSCTEMASVAHTYGRRILGAEAFTATDDERWQGHPANVKWLGDWAFCEGINRFVFHRYAAQPWTNVAPGMSMGPWGLHYERTQTWWEQSKAWHEYLARCQYLLQQGRFVADALYLQPEGAPRRFEPPADVWAAPNIRGGYNFDGGTPEVVLTRLRVQDGRLVLPDGMSYRVLVVPPVETMTPRLLRKLKDLADAGATILADARPPARSPSLADRGAGDAEVAKIAAELWPKLITGKTAAEALAERGVPPDFSATPLLRYIHRSLDGADVYFVANPEPQAIDATARFRIAGRRPEYWWPETGRTADAIAFAEQDGITTLPLHLEPHESVFVVFRTSSAGADPVIGVERDGQPVAPAITPAAKIVVRKASYGVLTDPARTRDVTAKVQGLVDGGTTRFSVADMARGDDPAYGTVKTLRIEYTAGGNPLTATGTDPEQIRLTSPEASPAPPAVDLARGEIWQSGHYVFRTAGGKRHESTVQLPAPAPVIGPWEVSFDPRWGKTSSAEATADKPGTVTFEKLEDWSKRPEEGIKYYSGTATYRTTFLANRKSQIANQKWLLELGQVAVMADVTLNGKPLGSLWKPPYRVDVTGALKDGENTLEIRVANLWINRQIGDENLPEDSDRTEKGNLKSWPGWLQEGKPSPTGRFTFSSWKLWKKNEPLVASGLLGPVMLHPVARVEVSP